MALKVGHNGYALTDRAPVKGNTEYQFTAGSSMPTRVLVYDADMHLLARLATNGRREIPVPEGASFIRLLYQTSFDHIPAYRTKTITKVGIQPVGETEIDVLSEVERASAEIVLKAGGDPREEYAARELQHWYREITGRRLPLLAEPSQVGNTKIFVGAKWASAYPDDLKSLADSDGYAVRRDGDKIYVFGSNSRGTLFGTHALLEKNTDIIWPRPNPEFTAIFSKKPEIDFAHSNFRSRPAFKFREIMILGSDETPDLTQQWIGRNGGNTPITMGKGFPYLRWLAGATVGAGGGYIWSFMGLEQEDETLYPLVNGNRLRNMWRQPCYTHPGVPELIAEKSREMLASVPGKEVEFLIARVGDNWETCGCPECMKPIPLEDGSVLAPKSTNSIKDPLFFSTRNYMMLNKVAENLVADHPDVKLHTHAYIFAAAPPEVKLHPAIVPHFAAYPTKNERYPILEQPTKDEAIWGDRFRQWSDEQDVEFGFFGYYYTPGFNALADTAGPDYKALAEIGGIHAHTEGFATDSDAPNIWDVDVVEKWILAKLQWDPTRDPAKLREECITRTYQDAAPKMREFYKLINDSWHDKSNPTKVNCHSSSKNMFQEFIVNPGLEKRDRLLLVEAEELASNPKVRKMIGRTLAMYDSYAADLSRLAVPLVPESTEQWSQYGSPHWYKAHTIDDFKQVANWVPVPGDAGAKHKTELAMIRDKDHLYFKIDAFSKDADAMDSPARKDSFPSGDRVEIVLRSGADTFYLAFGPDGGTYFLKNWDTVNLWENSTQVTFHNLEGKWVGLVAVKLSDLGVVAGSLDLDGKFCRVVNPKSPEREESTFLGRSIFNDHEMLRSAIMFTE